MIDICVNWFKSSFDKDREQILQRAKDANLECLFSTGADLRSSIESAELAKINDFFYATAGVHPHHASEWSPDQKTKIVALLQQERVLAVGECGLDFNRNFSTPEQQIAAFDEQIDLAIDSQLPLFMHQRDAHEQFHAMLKKKRDKFTKGVVHCFTGTEDEMRSYLDLDLHIGLTGWICDERRGFHMHDFIAQIPLNRLMIETDAPYLVPRTMKPRPSRNEPAFLIHIVEVLAEIYDLPCQTIIAETSKTSKDFYGI